MSQKPQDRRVKDIMSREVVSLRANATLHEALELMMENRVSAVPIVDRHDRCIGILSTSDLVDIAWDLEDELEQLERTESAARTWLFDVVGHRGHETVDGLMTEVVCVTKPDTTLSEATRDMLRNRIHRLPVVDNQERLVGIISTTDLLAALAEAAPAATGS